MDEYETPINHSFLNNDKKVSKDVIDIISQINKATFKDN